MAKTAVKFLRGHGRYNKGDIAGFEGEALRKLLAGSKPVAALYDAKAELSAEAALAQGAADLDAERADLAQRAKDLAAREAELVVREAALAAGQVAAPEVPDGQAQAETTGAGDPPKRGAGKTAAKDTGKDA